MTKDEQEREVIDKWIRKQTTKDLEHMRDIREEFLIRANVITEEYSAVKATLDTIEDELFLRSILGS